MKKVWLIYYRENAHYNKEYIRFYRDEGVKLGLDIELILIEELEFGVKDSQWFLWVNNKEITFPAFVIMRAIYPLLNRQLEYMGIKVYNNSIVAELCNDKAKTYQYLARTGIRMVDSTFYQKHKLKEPLQKRTEPTVIKSVDGHGGNEVFLFSPYTEMDTSNLAAQMEIKVPECLNHTDTVMQPLIGSKHQDLRVYVIGDTIIAAVLRTSTEGFRSNFSLGGAVCLYQLNEIEEELVQRIINEFEFGLVGIDFIIGEEGELVFNEIEDVVGSRMLYQCAPQINIVRLYLEFLLAKDV